MLKKYFLTFMLVFTAVCSIQADTWKLHGYYVTSSIMNLYDTGEKIYYLVGTQLYMFDKATLTTTSLNNSNILSDNRVSQIYYDCDNQLLFVAYTNSNIDVINAKGTVTNISGIKDVVVHVHDYTLTSGVLSTYSGKEINDIAFKNGKAYVATSFGYAVIDEATLAIDEFHNLGTKLNFALRLGDLMILATDSKCYYGPVGSSSPLTEYNSTTGTGSFKGAKILPIDESDAFIFDTSLLLYGFRSSGVSIKKRLVTSSGSCMVQKTSSGFIANFNGQSYYYTIDSTGSTATQASTSVGFATCDPNGDGTVWLLDANGLHINGSTAYYRPNAMTTDAPYWLKYIPALDQLFVGNSAANSRTTEDTKTTNIINTYDGTNWTNATPYTAIGGYEFVIDPKHDKTYLRPSWNTGIHRVYNNTRVMQYTKSNSRIGTYKPSVAFDNYGNMWTACSYSNSSCPVAVLTADQVTNYSITTSDWFQPSGLLDVNTNSMKRSRFIVAKKNNLKIYSDCDLNGVSFSGHLLCWDNGNEDPTVDTYKLANISSFIDQNNATIDWGYLTHIEEDNDGLIWVGHTAGLFVFDPTVAFDDNPVATRPYVANFSEGKGYLADGLTVYDIGVDRNNNKWIATSDNGLYYVSPDGSEIYNHFTTSNSDIPSDVVYSVECDTVNDRVYIYTMGGFAEYVAEGDAASLNFDDVYAFPNPVEPDFTGMIKIRGLMDNSYITITDRDGNVVEQLGPVMGSALWDGCDDNGERLPTGIYHIYAAQGSQPSVTGTPQARVMIIK